MMGVRAGGGRRRPGEQGERGWWSGSGGGRRGAVRSLQRAQQTGARVATRSRHHDRSWLRGWLLRPQFGAVPTGEKGMRFGAGARTITSVRAGAAEQEAHRFQVGNAHGLDRDAREAVEKGARQAFAAAAFTQRVLRREHAERRRAAEQLRAADMRLVQGRARAESQRQRVRV